MPSPPRQPQEQTSQDKTARDTVAARYAAREPWTQSLSHIAGLVDRGWACLVAGGAFLAIQARPEGAVGRMQRPRVIDLPQLRRICQRTPLTGITIEPAAAGVVVAMNGERVPWSPSGDEAAFAAVREAGWTPLRRSVSHTKTLVVDLAPGLPEVQRAFSTAARRNARTAARHHDVVYRDVSFDRCTPQLRAHLRSLNEVFLREHPGVPDEHALRVSLTRHFGGRGRYVLACRGEDVVGVVYLLLHDRVATYFVAITRPEATELRVPTGLIVNCMAVAQRQGCDLLDFGGVYDERFTDLRVSWRGFSQFKARFGGHPVLLPLGFSGPPAS